MNSINIGQIKCIFPTNNNNDIKKKGRSLIYKDSLGQIRVVEG